jgi:hypothetical protein
MDRLYSELAASAGNPSAARAWRAAIRLDQKRRVSEVLKGAFREAANGNANVSNRLAGVIVEMLSREEARRHRAAIADFVFCSLASIYAWGVVLLTLN